MSLLLESSGLCEPAGERLAAGMPAFGTCAGMILLAAEVLDGRPDQRRFGAIDIAVRRNAFGRQVDSFETDLDVAGLDGRAVPRRVHPGPGGRAGRAGRRGAGDACRRDDGRPAGGVPPGAGAGRRPSTPSCPGDLRLHELFLKGC